MECLGTINDSYNDTDDINQHSIHIYTIRNIEQIIEYFQIHTNNITRLTVQIDSVVVPFSIQEDDDLLEQYDAIANDLEILTGKCNTLLHDNFALDSLYNKILRLTDDSHFIINKLNLIKDSLNNLAACTEKYLYQIHQQNKYNKEAMQSIQQHDDNIIYECDKRIKVLESIKIFYEQQLKSDEDAKQEKYDECTTILNSLESEKIKIKQLHQEQLNVLSIYVACDRKKEIEINYQKCDSLKETLSIFKSLVELCKEDNDELFAQKLWQLDPTLTKQYINEIITLGRWDINEQANNTIQLLTQAIQDLSHKIALLTTEKKDLQHVEALKGIKNSNYLCIPDKIMMCVQDISNFDQKLQVIDKKINNFIHNGEMHESILSIKDKNDLHMNIKNIQLEINSLHNKQHADIKSCAEKKDKLEEVYRDNQSAIKEHCRLLDIIATIKETIIFSLNIATNILLKTRNTFNPLLKDLIMLSKNDHSDIAILNYEEQIKNDSYTFDYKSVITEQVKGSVYDLRTLFALEDNNVPTYYLDQQLKIYENKKHEKYAECITMLDNLEFKKIGIKQFQQEQLKESKSNHRKYDRSEAKLSIDKILIELCKEDSDKSFVEMLWQLEPVPTMQYIRPLCKLTTIEEFLGEENSSTVTYIDVHEQRRRVATTKLPVGVNFKKRFIAKIIILIWLYFSALLRK